LRKTRLKNNILTFIFCPFILAIISTCVYIPWFGLRSESGVIPDDVITSIQKEAKTREDLVLLIGGPDDVYEKERYFVYSWRVSHGVIGNQAWVSEPQTQHYFCVEFYKDNRIKRSKHIYGINLNNTNRELFQWMSGSDGEGE